jgi:hypothetical protein
MAVMLYKAIEAGDEKDVDGALGVMALRGEGMPKDEQPARQYLARAEGIGFDLAPYLRANTPERP